MNHKMNGFFLFLIVQSSKARVEYVQLLVFQMNSHRIDLQLAGRANSIYIEISSTPLFLHVSKYVRDYFIHSIGVQ